MVKRILLVGAVVIVLLGVGIYFTYFAKTPGLEVTAPSTSLPTAGDTTTIDGRIEGRSASFTEPATRVTDRLVKISVGPVVPGMAVVNIPAADASSTADVDVRFIERQSGNVYSYLVGTGKLTRTSNKTLPGIQEALWTPDGQTAFVRYLSGDTSSTIETYALSLDGSGGFFLPQGLSGLSVASTSILELASGTNGSIASLAHIDGTHSATLFNAPLSSLRVMFAGKNRYLAFTKPSSSLLGDLFVVDGSQFTRVAGPASGLVALASPSGAAVLVSTSASGVVRMNLLDIASGKVTALPVATVADKCVWAASSAAIYCGVPVAPSGEYAYPDDWYQGAVHFSDRIWKIDVAGRYAELVLDPSTVQGLELDAVALALDQAGSTLVFVNKNDGSLWSYQL